MQTIDQVYSDWEARWLLSNPRPTIELRDKFLDVLKYVVACGAIVLSGSRTGSVVASIGALSLFANQLGISSRAMSGIEAMLAFLTFDTAILLSGYILGDDKASERWYVVLFFTALIPSLAANVSPSFQLLGADVSVVAKFIVDIVVGICTPAMAFIAGRAIGATNNLRKKQMTMLLDAWQQRKNVAWTHSREYRKWIKEASLRNGVRDKGISDVSIEDDTRHKIIELLRSNKSMEVDVLAKQLNLPELEIWKHILTMPDVERRGSTIQLTDF